MRGGREEIRGCIQCEEANAAAVPGDDIVGTLEDPTDVLPVLCHGLDPVTGRTYARRKVRVI